MQPVACTFIPVFRRLLACCLLLISCALPVSTWASTGSGDSTNNGVDNCPMLDNPGQKDTDADGIGDACDNDDDNDGVLDVSDTFPLDASESIDSDCDGIGDNADLSPFGDGALLLKCGAAKNEQLGSSIAMADMNNDGIIDLLVGSPMANVFYSEKLLKKAGRIQIISGEDNSVIRTISGSVPNQQFGTAIAVVIDQNSDGVPDIIVGEPLADVIANVAGKNRKLTAAGRVALYSGSNGALLDVLAEGSNDGDHFGAAVAVGDVNMDGKNDLAIGVTKFDAVTAKDVGTVQVLSGAGL